MSKKIKFPYQYNPKKRKLAKPYMKGRLTIYFLDLFFSLTIALFILFSGLNVAIRNFVIQYPLSTLFYGFLFLLIFTILKFSLTFYSSYIYEHKFKLSRYTIPLWVKDFFKGHLVSYVLSLILIVLLYFTINNFSPWWVYASIFYILFMLFIEYIYPVVIMPFLWKTKPYRDRKMKEKILRLCKNQGVKDIKNVFVVKESEKSVKPNAFFYGLGNQQKIALFDNLLNDFTKDEVETVVGHELGHYVHKDIWRGLLFSAILIFPILFFVDYFVRLFSSSFGITNISDIASLPLIALIYGVLGFFLMPVINTFSRYRESQADEFALNSVRKPVAQISAEKRLADISLAEISTHPLIEFWLFMHPSTIRRIKMAEEWKKKLKK